MTTTDTVTQPDPEALGRRADAILQAILADDFEGWRLWRAFMPIAGEASTAIRSSPTSSSAPTPSRCWRRVQGARVKAARFELTDGDETTAERMIRSRSTR